MFPRVDPDNFRPKPQRLMARADRVAANGSETGMFPSESLGICNNSHLLFVLLQYAIPEPETPAIDGTKVPSGPLEVAAEPVAKKIGVPGPFED